MDFTKIKYGQAEVIKFVGFALVISSMWYDLKTDFAVHREEHKLIEYRIANLEAMNTYRTITPKDNGNNHR